MNIVDSSGWLEYFADGENADFFAPAIEDTENLIVPTVIIYEVFKRMLKQGIDVAELRIADLLRGQQVDFSSPLALSAAQLSVEYKLPLADSFILATAQAYDAVFWTQDEHFRDIPGIKYVAKK
jgi:predicted nucleic acid-binding protein